MKGVGNSALCKHAVFDKIPFINSRTEGGDIWLIKIAIIEIDRSVPNQINLTKIKEAKRLSSQCK
jgi:hypothetical protein